MTKIADSAAIKQNIPTRPRDGSFHAMSVVGMATASLMSAAPSFIFPVRVFWVFQIPKGATALHGRDGLEVVLGRRRGGAPLECPCIPRIISRGLSTEVG